MTRDELCDALSEYSADGLMPVLIEYDRLTAELLQEKAVKVQLLEALEAVEWRFDEYDEFCVWCGGTKSGGHEPDCQRQAAIRAAESFPTIGDVKD